MESKQLELKFCRINANADTKELLKAIKEILHEGNSHNAAIYTNNYWSWQYQDLPESNAHIYTCTLDDKIVGYYHIPVYKGKLKGLNDNFAMVQDVAFTSNLRGGGIFRKLASYANEELAKSGIDLIYTFPNIKSIHTFIKYNGYTKVCTYDAYILPVKTASIIKSKINLLGLEKIPGAVADWYFSLYKNMLKSANKVNVKEHFDEEVIELFQKFNCQFEIHLDRTKEYMNWRFFKKPEGRHFLVTLSMNNEVVASAVIKIDEVLGVDTAIILDFAFLDEKYLVQLIYYVRKNDGVILGQKISMIFIACCCNQFLQNKKYGFIKILEKYNPRPLNLLVKIIKETNLDYGERNNWLATLADWDVL
jgi:hypothetical protein